MSPRIGGEVRNKPVVLPVWTSSSSPQSRTIVTGMPISRHSPTISGSLSMAARMSYVTCQTVIDFPLDGCVRSDVPIAAHVKAADRHRQVFQQPFGGQPARPGGAARDD